MSVIDDYLEQVAPPQKEALERIRQVVLRILPDAKEVISYGMPGFKYKGKYLITFAAFKDHMSLFPGAEAVEVMSDKLTTFKISKGTIQFTLENPLPEDIVEQLVLARAASIS